MKGGVVPFPLSSGAKGRILLTENEETMESLSGRIPSLRFPVSMVWQVTSPLGASIYSFKNGTRSDFTALLGR